jgi:hypothetical protein
MKVISTKDFVKAVDDMAKMISTISGVINTTKLWQYIPPDSLFSTHVVKKETTEFKPSPGLAFKVR